MIYKIFNEANRIDKIFWEELESNEKNGMKSAQKSIVNGGQRLFS